MPRQALEYIVNLPSGISSFNGINIPWLQFETGGETKHDGYGNGFDDSYFNGTNGNTSLTDQLDTLSATGIKTIRLWLNIYHYMNADKATVGYTAFRSGFLTNLATYCDWCEARGIKMIICLDDCWYTFPWTWINDAPKRASYIQACKDVVTALKDKPAVWGWDYCNEPYMGWSWSNVNSTVHHHSSADIDIGYDRLYLTNFFKELYVQLKTIAPTHMFSVGSTTPPYQDSYDLSRWDIKNAVDFYQVHYYTTNVSNIKYYASEFDKPVIVGECGHSDSSGNVKYPEFHKRLVCELLRRGFGLIMPWSSSQALIRNGTGVYSLNKAINQTKLWQG